MTIPTCVVDRLDNEMGSVVLSRPNAFKQYFEKCGDIEEDYVLRMAEPDDLPLPAAAGEPHERSNRRGVFFTSTPRAFPS